jgi:hypothetical protein
MNLEQLLSISRCLEYLQWARAVTGAAFSSARKLHRPENRGDLKIEVT